MVIEAYKFRLYPTEEQKVLLNKHFGSVRFVYNWALDLCQRKYKTNEKFLGWMGIVGGGDFIKLKEENPWLYEVNSQSIVNSISHLGRAFDNFFKHRGRFPKFKSKHDNSQSFEVPAGLTIDFKHRKIQIPKFLNKKNNDNRIKFILSRKVPKGKIGTATISKNPSGEYYISFIVHVSKEYPEFNKDISKGNSLGIDFGLKHFLTFSDGRIIDSPEYFKQGKDKLAKEQRKLSKKQKGSRNREKQRVKVAKAYQHITNQRMNYLHRLTMELINESQFDVFCLEDLNLKGMSKLWGRKVSDLSYNSFQTMLQYKAAKFGKKVIKIGRFDSSTQICSHCGHRQKMPLDRRVYECPECGLRMDRDVNAALNIRDFAICRSILKISNTDGTSGINAFGDGSSGLDGESHSGETTVDELGKFPGKVQESCQSSVGK